MHGDRDEGDRHEGETRAGAHVAGWDHPSQAARLADAARSIAGGWGLSPATRATVLGVSENVVLRLDDPERDGAIAMRVHRPGHRSRAEIASEIAWTEALREEGAVAVPALAPRRDGTAIGTLALDGRAFDVVAHELLAGTHPSPDDGDAPARMRSLGAIAARLHAHAARWRRPQGFARPRWTHETTLGARAMWGDWRAAPGLDRSARRTLERVSSRIEARLRAYGATPDRFGLIHGDLRHANLLANGEALAAIDFDDCGEGWFAYDFAAAVSFLETDPRLPLWRAAWLEGYRGVAPFGGAHEAMLPDMVMLRRMLLTAWVASRPGAEAARDFGPGFAEGTLALGEAYLAAR